MTPRIAIIGAGFSGLTLARALSDVAEVQVFEKARGVGGRMSTRYADPFYFDHGTQFFTARTKAFQEFITPLLASGHIAEWQGKTVMLEQGKKPEKGLWFEPHYVATPNMNSLCKMLAEGMAVTANLEIAPLTPKQPDGWHLTDKNGAAIGVFDWVISTAPPVQTMKLFSGFLPFDMPLSHIRLLGCYTLMIGFNKPWDKSWIAAKIRENPLQWVAVNSSKPGRDKTVTSLVVHSRNDWAEEHIDDDMAASQAFLVEQFQSVTGIDCNAADYLSTHRWRYAIVEEPQGYEPYTDRTLQLASVSDWCTASRIEDVWNNAMKLASALQAMLPR